MIVPMMTDPAWMVQSVSASVTDRKFRLDELGMGSNPYPVGHLH